jgi:transcriptional regulator with PAS, ATPase and Fis domain
VIAALIHAQSARRGQPFVRINCAALNEALLESELFGHEKGAFTGAVQAKPGLLEAAGDGTVFLDEIGELPSRLQPKLLHALEARQVPRVGGLSGRPIAARFIAATNRELPAEMAAGNFRPDLFYRLATFVIRIPALRDRVDDIVPLARRFLGAAATRSGVAAPPALRDDAVAALLAHPWPGNIRELRNVIERVLVMAQGRPITAADLALVEPPATPPPGAPSSMRDGAGAGAGERARIIRALVDARGNQSAAARELGMSRGTLLSRLDAYQIARPRKRPITPS